MANHSNIDASICMPELTLEEKRSLFFKITKMTPSKIAPSDANAAALQRIEECIAAIPPFPLDISIAAHYLKMTHAKSARYLEDLYEGSAALHELHHSLLKDRGDYAKTRRSIVITSLKKVLKENDNNDHHNDDDHYDKLATLMLFISSLGSQNISRSLLDNYIDHLAVDKFIYKLKKYSIINDEEYPKEGMISMHRSIQGIARAWLAEQLSLKNNNKTLLAPLVNELRKALIEAIDQENNADIELLSGHCETLLKNDSISSQAYKNSLVIALGIAYYNLGYDAKAIQILQTSLTNLSSNSEEAAEVLAHIGNIHRRLGDYKASKEALNKSIKIYTMFLGIAYRLSGDDIKATEHLKKSINIYKATPGNDLGAARARVYLGTVYGKLGDYTKARNILTQSLEFYSTYTDAPLGNARALAHLGVVDRMLGNYQKAQSGLEESLEIYHKFRSEKHIDIGWVSFHLGAVYKKLGDSAKAKKLLEHALSLYDDHFGADHTETARVLNGLAEVHLSQNSLDDAETLAKKALNIFNNNKHPERYLSLELLSDIFLVKAQMVINSGNFAQANIMKNLALDYIKDSLNTVRKKLPQDSEHVIRLQKKLDGMRVNSNQDT